MANHTKNVILGGATLTVPESQTTAPISGTFRLADASGPLIIEVTISATTVSAGINLILQDSINDNDAVPVWNDKKTTAVANAFTGTKIQTYLVEVTADQTHYPFRPKGRVVCTTGAGDSITITSVKISQNWQ